MGVTMLVPAAAMLLLEILAVGTRIETSTVRELPADSKHTLTKMNISDVPILAISKSCVPSTS